MLEVFAVEYVDIGSCIRSIQDTFGVDVSLDGTVPASVHKRVTSALASLLGRSHELKLAVCVNIADECYRAYSKAAPTYRQVREDVHCLERAFRAELEARRFFFVPPHRSCYYTEECYPCDISAHDGLAERLEPFRPAMKAFPAMEHDLIEAGNTFALDRFTACVFHLMRVMEVGLKVVAKALGVAYISDWGQCLRDIEKQCQQLPDQFFRDASLYLRSVKNAWRNPTMHVEKRYSESEAERIFQSVQSFMVHLATKLSE
jgi:hypothetical protein